MTHSFMSTWGLVILAGMISTLGNLSLKKASNMASSDFMSLMFNPYFATGLFFYGINVLLFVKALEVLDVSKAYPVLAAVGFSSLSILAFIFFKETLSIINYFGIFVIVVGIYLLGK